MRQPEVGIAIKYLAGWHWVGSTDILKQTKGRPIKKYFLAVPFEKIIEIIGIEKQTEMNPHLDIIGKMSEEHSAVSG